MCFIGIERVSRMHRDIKESHPLDVDLENRDVSAQASGHSGSIDSRVSSTHYDNIARKNSWDAAKQYARSSTVLRQKVSAHDYRHPTCDLAHWLQQRQTPIHLNRFVRYRGDTRIHQDLRQSLRGCQMEVGKQDLTFTQKRIFGGKRFLHLHQQIALLKNLRMIGGEDGARLLVFVVGISGAGSRVSLNVDLVTQPCKEVNDGWQNSNPMFLFLYFLRNTHAHAAL